MEHVINREETVTFSPDNFVYVTSLCVSGMLLFLLVYFIITFSDFECDYLNAVQCCNRLNMWVLPRFGVHVFLTLLWTFSGHYWLFLTSVPMVLYLFYQYKKVPRDNIGVYDPYDITRPSNLKAYMMESIFGIAYYLVSFFVYLYCFLTHLLKQRVPLTTFDEEEDL